MNAARLCTREVVTCSARITLAEAAATMRAEHAGDLVVVREQDGQRWPVGILTDRDIVVAVVGQDAEPDALLVGELMSRACRGGAWGRRSLACRQAHAPARRTSLAGGRRRR
ncbi:CBS domain-containing protein [Burkholderia gladioli]|uniref:CBS domain-containing protein n=1 Tax=Burkholderia gladioli TaxID=28095 RepID=UPI0026B2790A